MLLALVLFFGRVGSAWAQSVGDLYQRSIQAGSDYRQKHNAYQLARNQHVQYQTAATRVAAFNATKNVLQSRNSWQIAYLTYIRSYLAQETDIANYTQTTFYLDLESEISSLNSLTFNSGDTVEAINQSSLDWENRLKLSDKLVAASTVQITSAKLASLQAQLQTFIDASHSSDVTTLNLIKQKLQSSIDLRVAVDTGLRNYKTSNWQKSTFINQLTQSKQLLFDAGSLLAQLTND